MKQEKEIEIRYTYVTDVVYLRQWLTHPGILNYFPMSPGQEVEDMMQSWINFSRWHAGLTATLNHTPCAMGILFLMPYQKIAHQALFKMIVDPKRQREGIGSSLLKNLKHLAKNYFHLKLLNIEIFEDNPMEHLLKNQGFELIFRQEGFVKEEGKTKARLFWEAVL